MKNSTNLLIFLAIISFVIMGCAKSDDSSSSTSSSTSDADDTVSAASGSSAITLSSKISLVSAKTTDSTARTAFATVSTDNLSSTSDYKIDKTQKFVYEKSADALETVNMILCMIGQTRAGLMVNTGNYKAQIDESKCEERSGDSKTNNPEYNMWRVNASRADGEPMIVKVWVPNDNDRDGTNDSLIYAKAKVWQPPSDDYPIGHFKLNFKGLEGKTATGTQFMHGYMRTRKKGSTSTLQFWNPEKSGSTTYDYSVTAKFNTDGTGSGITTMPVRVCNESGCSFTGSQKTYKVAVGDDYFYKQKTITDSAGADTTTDAVCLNRNKYLKSAWRYGMYYKGTNNDNGSRVVINSGFPIKASNNSVDYYGYIGYHGLWMPTEASVADNSTVYKLDFSGSADQTGTGYTVRSWGGKLNKWTKNTTTLDAIKGIPLEWWDGNENKSKRVYWNGSNLKIDALRDASTWEWTDQTEATLTLSSLNAPRGFDFYSQALGGQGMLKLTYGSWPTGHNTPAAPTGSTPVVFNTRTPVFPGDNVPRTLACYYNCPNPATIATGNEETAYFRFDGVDNLSNTNPYLYTFDNTTSGMVLQYNGAYDNGTQDNGTKTPVLLSSANSNLRGGVQSSIMFDNDTLHTRTVSGDNKTTERATALAALQCYPSYDNNTLCPWEARNAFSTFYTWETGPDAWNKLTVLVDSDNSSVKFDPPMVVKYTHSDNKSNSGKNYDNATFYLEYGGHGDLWGVPSFCVDAKTGEKVSCANDGTTRWVPEFVIKKASLVTQVKDGSTQYLVKPLQVEQTMKKTSSASVCTDAGLSFGTISLPDSEPYSDPDIGERPTVEGPPAIVAGAKM